MSAGGNLFSAAASVGTGSVVAPMCHLVGGHQADGQRHAQAGADAHSAAADAGAKQPATSST